MGWQFWILTSVAFFAISSILQKRLMKGQDSDPVAYAIVFQVLVGVLIGGTGLLLGQLQIPANWADFGWNYLLMAAFYGIGNIFVFNALKHLDVSKFGIIFATRSLVTILVIAIIFGSSLAPRQLLGTLVLFVSSVLVLSVDANSKLRFKLDRGEIYAVLAALSFGLAVANDRAILPAYNSVTYLAIAFIAPAILIGLIYPRNLPKIKVFAKPQLLGRMLVFCVIYGISAIAFFNAYSDTANSAAVIGVNQFSTVLTVILGIIFLRERHNLVLKIITAILGLVGLLLLNGIL